MDTEPGLLQRHVIIRDAEKVVITEMWDLTVPGCPIMRVNRIDTLTMPEQRYVRQVTMTPAEYAERFKD